jgi:hypothetical protein
MSESIPKNKAKLSSDKLGQVAPAVALDESGQAAKQHEIGGPEGPEPTRYGDWERKGRCIDF